MTGLSRWIRRDLQSFKPYQVRDVPWNYKLDANESPYNMPEGLKSELIRWIETSENLNRYPDTENTSLREALADFWGLSSEHIICGVGSDQIIDYITKAFLEHGEKILELSPTFSMYSQSAVINKGAVVSIDLGGEYVVDEEAVLETAVREKVKIIFLCAPNNPTGTGIETVKIKKILSGAPCLTVVDEAYTPFDESPMREYIEEYDNLIILRTFSKYYGLAGARVGYAMARREIINGINTVKAPFNMPVLSQFLAEAALRHLGVYKERTREITKERERMSRALSGFSWLRVYSSQANFIYTECGFDMAKQLEAKGILIRRLGEGRFRITVGREHENNAVLEALKDMGGI